MHSISRVLFFIWIALFPLFRFSLSQEELIEQCLTSKLAGKRLRQVNQDALMHLTLGQYGIETMNALSLHQMRQITYLSECVAEIVPYLFIATKENDAHYNKYGGNNVTYINSLFSKVLPSLKRHILYTAQQARTQSAWKHKPIPSPYGIRSAYILSSDRPGMKLFLDMIQDKNEENRNWKKAKIPSDINPTLYHRLRAVLKLNKTEEVSYRQRFISDHVGSDLTIIVMLSEAKNSCRGDYLHLASDDHLFTSTSSDNEYDDEDEHLSPPIKKKPPAPTATTIIDNFTPEKGSILTLRGRYHGPEEAVCGQRQMLVLELWRFQDAPLPLDKEEVGEMMSEEEGATLGLAEELEADTNVNSERNEL